MVSVTFVLLFQNTALAESPVETPRAYDRGLQHLERGETSLAIEAWRQYVERNPTGPTTRTIQAYLTLLVREKAKQDARKAIGQERSLVEGPFEDRALAVMAFEDLGATNRLATAMHVMVISDLAKVPDLQIVERVKLQALLSEMRLWESGLVEEATAIRVGRLLGAGTIVTGTVFESDRKTESYQMATSLSKTENGQQIGYQEAAGVRRDWFILQKEIVFEILKDLGISPIPSSVRQIHTENWEAYVQFATGLDLLDRGDFDAARKAFQNALTLDIGFELAREALQETPPLQLSVPEILSHAKAKKVEGEASLRPGVALLQGTPYLKMRLRYEYVDQDSSPNDAHALTVRTRVGYRTGTFFNFQALAEVENTHAFSDDYNVPLASPYGPRDPSRPNVWDPEVTHLNQLMLDYSLPFNTRVRLGRQKVILDDARFIGSVGWAQNEQTFDAVTVQSEALPNVRLFYAYFARAMNYYGSDKDMNSHVINANRSWIGNVPLLGHTWIKLAGYGYLLDFEEDKGTDTKTFGIFMEGDSHIVHRARLRYHLQYASQKDYEDSQSIDTDYYRLELGSQFSRFAVTLGYEVMTSDRGLSAFQTPLSWGYNDKNGYLGMPHTFNGWAHKFLKIPADGLEDLFLSLETTLAGIRLRMEYHDFSSERGDTRYGTETDVMAIKQLSRHFTVGLKYANYRAEGFSEDTTKAQIFGEMSF
jgi:hypothetical protein